MERLTRFQAQVVLAGTARAEVLAADVPLSFWGGFDPETGRVVDQRHPLAGLAAAGRVLVIPSGRGSCSGSGVLLEAIRNGTAPAAIITSRIDPVISLGAVLGDEIYGAYPPVIVVTEAERRQIGSGDVISVDVGGLVTITRRARPLSPLNPDSQEPTAALDQ